MDWSELSNWHEYSRLFIGLFALTPPAVIIPIFLGLVGERPRSEQLRIAAYACLGFVVTLLIFVFFGEAILELFGISISAFRMAGGLLLLIMALEMLRSDGNEGVEEGEGKSGSSQQADASASLLSISLVPLAIPILAGPGTISTIIIYAQQHEGLSHLLLVSGVILSVAVVVYLLFRLSLRAGALFTPATALVFNRIMGLIIAAIAIEFLLHGVAGHFPDVNIVHF